MLNIPKVLYFFFCTTLKSRSTKYKNLRYKKVFVYILGSFSWKFLETVFHVFTTKTKYDEIVPRIDTYILKVNLAVMENHRIMRGIVYKSILVKLGFYKSK